MNQWVIYDHPSDYPDSWVARRFAIGVGTVQATEDVLTGPLEMLRDHMFGLGLYCLPRQVGDDPVIVEVWI